MLFFRDFLQSILYTVLLFLLCCSNVSTKEKTDAEDELIISYTCVLYDDAVSDVLTY